MSLVLLLSLYTICGAYTLLLLLYRRGWRGVPLQKPRTAGLMPAVSVVVAARNEAERLPALLDSLGRQDYPNAQWEVIVVDDHSDDDTALLALSFPGVRCIRMAEMARPEAGHVAFKKAALTAGIAQATGEYIVTTDADCTAPPGWLSSLVNAALEKGAVMIAAPVAFTRDGSVLQAFQAVDFMMMQGITAASHALRLGGMANGANLLFRKDAFEAAGGYSGAQHIASGDDFLLLAKLLERFPDRISYLKSAGAIIQTAPQLSWASFLSQRVRWASKTGRYKDYRLTSILILVYLFNVVLFSAAVAAIFVPAFRIPVCIVLLAKITGECILFVPVARFFGQSKLVLPLILLQPLHILYIVMAGFFGMLGNYTWKGRKVH